MNVPAAKTTISLFLFLDALADFTNAPQESVSKGTDIRILLYEQRLAF
jgi:hypothetical protein